MKHLLLLLFLVVLSVYSRDFTNFNDCYEEECEVEDEDLETKASPTFTEEKQCELVRNELFTNINESREIHRQWKRFLPVFMKTQYNLFTDNRGEQEFPLGHERFNILGPVGAKCKNKFEKYGDGDEEKRVCGLSKLQTMNKARTINGKEECVVISIGSNDQWNFETVVIQKTSCRIETFDCTVSSKLKPPKELRSRVNLHRICLGDSNSVRNGGQKYMNWPSLLQYLNLTTPPTYLKMDIEGYEFPGMKSMIDSGVNLPLQISMEIHVVRHENNVPVYNRRVSSLELYAFMDYLYEFGGYHLVDRRDNPYCISCSEIVLAKLDCEKYYPLEVAKYDLLRKQTEPHLKSALAESFQEEYYH